MTIRFGKRALCAAVAGFLGAASLLVPVGAFAEAAPATPRLTLPPISEFAPELSARPALRPRVVVEELPDLRWDHINGSERWTRAAMRALDSHGNRLIDTVPDDIGQWCPAYPEADRWSRKAFWAGLLSTLAKHESTYRPHAVGGGNLWFGLVQIYPPTARGYGCQARTGDALKNGELNMSCAVRIMNLTVPRDNVVSRGMRGVAADWGPFHSRRKREDMRRWISSQPFCQGLHASMRPVARPAPVSEPTFVAFDEDTISPVGGTLSAKEPLPQDG